ncbi:MAG: DUF4250 domain-containing protein [Muribaculaceae bacterium]|nr:DUF4250 domain-containing protein [Muribaculaceae bacterium]
MYLPNDPNMLLSIINMKLRDEGYSSFDEMCQALDLDKEGIEKRLNEAGFEYMAAPVNQFR